MIGGKASRRQESVRIWGLLRGWEKRMVWRRGYRRNEVTPASSGRFCTGQLGLVGWPTLHNRAFQGVKAVGGMKEEKLEKSDQIMVGWGEDRRTWEKGRYYGAFRKEKIGIEKSPQVLPGFPCVPL